MTHSVDGHWCLFEFRPEEASRPFLYVAEDEDSALQAIMNGAVRAHRETGRIPNTVEFTAAGYLAMSLEMGCLKQVRLSARHGGFGVLVATAVGTVLVKAPE